ncbi:MAG TPA: glycosyltransferase family 4 protein [Actinomycetota bacterium]|jgi:glycosyltransferase involved in cell wall biosynthesis
MLCVIDGLGFGGAERSLAELLPDLEPNGIEPTIACLRHRDGGVEPQVLEQGHDVRFLPSGRLAKIRAVRGMIRDTSASLVYTSLVGASLVGRLAAAGTGVPVLTSLVNQSYSRERMADPHVKTVAVRGIRLVDGWTARHLTTHFHAITHAVKRSASETLGVPPERITVVERGRDPARLGEPGADRRLRTRRLLGLPEDAEVLVAVGRQEFQKGHRYLVEAMGAVRSAHPGAILLLAGRDGAESSHLRALVRDRGLDGAVRFLGHRDDLPDVLACADIFVFPSLWEGLGGSVLEAMALAVPIVASDLEPVREVVDDGRCAVLVPSRDPRALASALASVLDDPDRARTLGTTGRQIFLERFTLEHSTKRMIEMFRRVAGARPGMARADGDGLEVA